MTNGWMVTCDRCKKKIFIPRKWSDARRKCMGDGWVFTDYRACLCPSCVIPEEWTEGQPNEDAD